MAALSSFIVTRKGAAVTRWRRPWTRVPAWCCAVFVGKRFGNKGYPQINAAHVRWTLPVTSSSPLKQHRSGERFPDDDVVERAVRAWFRQQPHEILCRSFPGTCEMVGQVFKFVWRLRWKINAVCMSLSSFVSFQVRFVTYLLTFPHKKATARA